MRVEVGTIANASAGPLRDPRRAVVAHLHDDHHSSCHQCPAASGKPQLLADAKLPDCGEDLSTPNRNAPFMLAGVHVDGNDASKRWLEQWHPGWTRQVPEFADVVVR